MSDINYEATLKAIIKHLNRQGWGCITEGNVDWKIHQIIDEYLEYKERLDKIRAISCNR